MKLVKGNNYSRLEIFGKKLFPKGVMEWKGVFYIFVNLGDYESSPSRIYKDYNYKNQWQSEDLTWTSASNHGSSTPSGKKLLSSKYVRVFTRESNKDTWTYQGKYTPSSHSPGKPFKVIWSKYYETLFNTINPSNYSSTDTSSRNIFCILHRLCASLFTTATSR